MSISSEKAELLAEFDRLEKAGKMLNFSVESAAQCFGKKNVTAEKMRQLIEGGDETQVQWAKGTMDFWREQLKSKRQSEQYISPSPTQIGSAGDKSKGKRSARMTFSRHSRAWPAMP
jgi:hypothetical protein